MLRILKNYRNLFCIVLFLGFTSCIYAPYEMYITNRNEFWFHLSNFWWIPFIFGLVAMTGAIFTGLLLIRAGGIIEKLYEALLFAFGLGFYLQGNFFNLDVGVMNGDAVNWKEYRISIAINLVIWIICFGTVIMGAIFRYGLWRRLVMASSLLLTVMQVVALISIVIPNMEQLFSSSETSFFSERGAFEVSEKGDIIVLLLDSFDETYMNEILNKEPELKEKLNGFTCYSNSSGSYSTTLYSILYLMTGIYDRNELPYGEWVNSLNDSRLYWDELTEAGWRYYLYTDGDKMPGRIRRNASNYEEVPLKIGNWFGFTHDLYQFVGCKYLPDIAKLKIWMQGTEFEDWKQPAYGDYKAWKQSNFQFKDNLQKVPIQRVEERSIKFIHLEGAHSPYTMDENANQTSEGVLPVQKARGSLLLVEQYLDQLKDLQVYDSSAIIVMADHGYSQDGTLTSPLLMVKPPNKSDLLRISRAPVSHADFPATILNLAGLNLNGEYGKSIFEINEGDERERLYYQYYYESEWREDWTYRLIEYRLDNEGNSRENYHLTDVEYTVDGQKIQHSRYCELCQNGGPTKEQLEEYDPPRIVHKRIAGMKIRH